MGNRLRWLRQRERERDKDTQNGQGKADKTVRKAGMEGYLAPLFFD
jgi:hypothetical protein